jgi:cobalt-zinc-cadmium efflux system membrane fusion protein
LKLRHPSIAFPGLALAVSLAAGSISCGSTGRTAQAAAQEQGALQPSLFSVPENQREHLQIDTVRTANWHIAVRGTGTVDWDGDHTTQAIAQVSGPINRILVDTGAIVPANAPLLSVASPDITNAIATYRKARNRQDFQMRNLERSKDLYEHKAIAQRDLESAQADCNDAATDLQNALQALRIFGIPSTEIDQAERQGTPINPELPVRAPIQGMIVQKLVFPGQLIQAGATTCFLISDPSTVWVQGHIYDYDLASVHLGEPVDVTSAAFSGVLHGVVSNIGAMVDPATRTTPVRITTKNPQGLLKKDLFVDVVIHTGTRRNLLAVPTSAVLFDANNLPFVYLQAAPGRFAQRQITTGKQLDSEWEVLAGLKEGDQVITQGAVFLQFANTYQK